MSDVFHLMMLGLFTYALLPRIFMLILVALIY